MFALRGHRMAITAKVGGRVAIPCPTCRATVCYVSAEQVKRVKRQAGFALLPDESVISTAADAAALRCVTCEGIAIASSSHSGGAHGGTEAEGNAAQAEGSHRKGDDRLELGVD
jgi:hypothetical protein